MESFIQVQAGISEIIRHKEKAFPKGCNGLHLCSLTCVGKIFEFNRLKIREDLVSSAFRFFHVG